MVDNWYYYDDEGLKQGIFSGGQIKYLAKVGIIAPETLVENDEGKIIPAGRLKGLEFAKKVQRENHRQKISLPTLDELIHVAKPRMVLLAMLGFVCLVVSALGVWWLLFMGWLVCGIIVAMFVIVLTVMEMAGNYTVSIKAVIDWLLSNSK